MTQISIERLDEMFLRANLSREQLHDAYRALGGKLFRNYQFRKMWKPERPSLFQCYITSELIYWYTLAAEASSLSVCTTHIPSQPGVVHWFLVHRQKGIIDCTADQFDNYSEIDYTNSRKTFFLQSACVGPSSRAKLLAQQMGFV